MLGGEEGRRKRKRRWGRERKGGKGEQQKRKGRGTWAKLAAGRRESQEAVGQVLGPSSSCERWQRAEQGVLPEVVLPARGSPGSGSFCLELRFSRY